MSEPTWRERVFGGFRKTSERLAENLAVVSTTRLDQATLEFIHAVVQFRGGVRDRRGALLVLHALLPGVHLVAHGAQGVDAVGVPMDEQ